MTIREAQAIISITTGVSAEMLLLVHNGKGKPTRSDIHFLIGQAEKKRSKFPKYFKK